MSNPVPDSKTPVFAALAFVAVGLIIGLAFGITKGTILGGIVAAAGAIPACIGMWKGIQQQTQTTLAMSVGVLLLSLGVGGVLIILRVIDWVR
ncbi:MAG: hypothetical protein H6709_22750 [Kofleriaceae bacterium]|nr:hypothetical protein [Myxococcales bacterium]MCB9560930.1 hypothetical protein [Kofleriaceae bacterium]MCB9574902.1 hypothetical protein [Kofleriaceae bacterium]